MCENGNVKQIWNFSGQLKVCSQRHSLAKHSQDPSTGDWDKGLILWVCLRGHNNWRRERTEIERFLWESVTSCSVHKQRTTFQDRFW